MIQRIRHDWTTPDNADRCLSVLSETVTPGLFGSEVLRQDVGDEVEFATIMTFRSIGDVVAFQRPEYARNHVPAAAREVLSRWDETAAHLKMMILPNPAEP